MGLVLDGGVYFYINYLKVLVDIVEDVGVEQVFIYVFMDGRDIVLEGGKVYLEILLNYFDGKSIVLVIVIGCYYVMDCDKCWECIKLVYDLIVKGEGEYSNDILVSMQVCYDDGQIDEFIKFIVLEQVDGIIVFGLQDDDVFICFNFRIDCLCQILEVFIQCDFLEQNMKKLDVCYFIMICYDESFENLEVFFEKNDLLDMLGEVFFCNGKMQVCIVEIEKYVYVIFFFNGGCEELFEYECCLLIFFLKEVVIYDFKLEMSVLEIVSIIIEDMQFNIFDFICFNFVNIDMVGYIGVFFVVKVVVEIVDECFG